MATISPQYFTNLAQYLNIPVGKIIKKDHLFVRETNNQSTAGIINIIFSLLRDSKSDFGARNVVEEALIHQWLEYSIVYAGNANSGQNIQTLLKELNNILSTKTYLVQDRLTVADMFLYNVLVTVMANLSNLDKEKFLNVSRWFDNIQQDPAVRQQNKLIDFSTNYLATIVPARH